MFKIKSEKFKECGSGVSLKQKSTYNNTDWIMSLVNSNRIDSAISKIGNHNIDEIVQLVLEDLFEECGTKYNQDIINIKKNNIKMCSIVYKH